MFTAGTSSSVSKLACKISSFKHNDGSSRQAVINAQEDVPSVGPFRADRRIYYCFSQWRCLREEPSDIQTASKSNLKVRHGRI